MVSFALSWGALIIALDQAIVGCKQSMPLDQAIVGSVVTGSLALLGACVSKLKCFLRLLPNEDGEGVPSCGCGFTDSRLVPNDSRLETHEINDNDLLVIKKGR